MRTSRFSSFFSRAIGASLVVLLVGVLSAADTRKNPTSKLYVADTKGPGQIDTGEKIEPLSVKTAYNAEGASIETKADSANTFVFSNGSALAVGPNCRFEVKKFVQEPFTPNRNDLEVEPSISQTVVKISQGCVGLCTSRLVAGSSMTYQTPHGSINVRGHKILVDVSENETVISLLEGDVTVLSTDGSASQTLKPGQQAVLHQAAAGQAPSIETRAITPEASSKADEQVSIACIARRTVFFEAVDPNSSDIQAVQIQTANLPTDFTVSKARLTQ